jgi:hypothetical protein
MFSAVERDEERRAKNENLFRRINEGIEEVVEHSRVVHSTPVAFVCECSRPDCSAALEMSLEEYKEVRRNGHRFLVAPGHEDPQIERVVDVNLRYAIVEKLGQAGAIAEADA